MSADDEDVVSMRWYALTAEECYEFVAAMVSAQRTSETTMQEHFRGYVWSDSLPIPKMIKMGLIKALENWRGLPDLEEIYSKPTPKGGLSEAFNSGPKGFIVR